MALTFASGLTRAEPAPTFVFICEHGYAKSLVAALHFERLAQSRGLSLRALARGIDPRSPVPEVIQARLIADGFDIRDFAPTRPTSQEISTAEMVVLIGVDADVPARPGAVLRWDAIPPLSANHERARSELLNLASPLLDRIEFAAAQTRPNA